MAHWAFLKVVLKEVAEEATVTVVVAEAEAAVAVEAA